MREGWCKDRRELSMPAEKRLARSVCLILYFRLSSVLEAAAVTISRSIG